MNTVVATKADLTAGRRGTASQRQAERHATAAPQNPHVDVDRFKTASGGYGALPVQEPTRAGKPHRVVAGKLNRPEVEGRATTKTRSASETRLLALSLQRFPVPCLTRSAIGKRWQVGPDTVRKILRHFGVDPKETRDAEIPLTDILLCEGISDPLETWIFADPEGRKILVADLMTLEEWRAEVVGETTRDPTKYYRRTADRPLPSIRIGKLHRFRSTLDPAQRGLAIEGGIAS